MLGIAVSSVNRVLAANWNEIVARVQPDLLPRQKPAQRYPHAVDEYGCGHYGCVAPTGRPGVVVKITSDPTEVRFVKLAMEIGEWPDGIVRYHDIIALRGGYRGRPIYMIWREEAFNVGTWVPAAYWCQRHAAFSKYDDKLLRQFEARLAQFKHFAQVVKEAASHTPYEAARVYEDWAREQVAREDIEAFEMPQRLRADRRMAYALRSAEVAAEMMANEDKGYLVGRALEFYLEHKIVLADVHQNNIGEAKREEHGGMMLVITDPGHAVVLE